MADHARCATRRSPSRAAGPAGGGSPTVLGVGLVALALLLSGTGPAWGATAAAELLISPESGGPGSQVAVSGSGFCARSGCSPVRLSVLGQRVGQDVRPDGQGRIRTTITMPGGMPTGNADVEARQVLEDGNEVVTYASFTYSPSKGEAAEREAETRDFLTNLLNPSAPVPAAHGSALTDAAPSDPPEPRSSAASAPAPASPAAPAGDDRPWLSGLGAVLAAALAGAAALRLRSRRRRSLTEEAR